MNTTARCGSMLALVLLLPAAGFAGNLVKDPGFEGTPTSSPSCDNPPLSYSVDLLSNWTYPSQDQPGDYLTTAVGTLSCLGQTPVPHAGSAHAGVVMGTTQFPTRRSFIEGLLNSPGLIAGHSYLVGFYARRLGTDAATPVGIYMSDGPLQDGNGLTPHVSATLLDQHGYVHIQGVYTSTFTSTHTNITLGSFDTSSANPPRYIFIDDVSVEDCADFAVISQQPTSQVLTFGQDVTFSVQASGPGITGYRWQRLDPTPVDLHDTDEDGYAYTGTGTSTLTIVSPDYCDVGIYRCNVSYTCGILASQIVALECVDVPSITSQPVDVTCYVGDPAMFHVGLFPLIPACLGYTYSWSNDTKQISLNDNPPTVTGAMTSTLHFSPTVSGQAGLYTCYVTNLCGTTASQQVRLTFLPNRGHGNKKVIFTVSGHDQLPKIDRVMLMQNSPNPFNPETQIRFGVPHDTDATLSIYDSAGRLVRRLVTGQQHGGTWQSVTWDGRSDRGESLASGVYFYQLKAEGVLVTKKMVLLK